MMEEHSRKKSQCNCGSMSGIYEEHEGNQYGQNILDNE